MAVPYLQARYGGSVPKRDGLKHPSIAPYCAFTCADDRELVISIQNEREWANFCRIVLGDESLPNDPRFSSNAARTHHREELEAIIQGIFSGLSHAQAVGRLTDAQTAYGAINSVQDLIGHPQSRTHTMTVNGQSIQGFRCRQRPIGWNGMSPSFAARRRWGSTTNCLSPRNSTRLRFDRCQA